METSVLTFMGTAPRSIPLEMHLLQTQTMFLYPHMGQQPIDQELQNIDQTFQFSQGPLVKSQLGLPS